MELPKFAGPSLSIAPPFYFRNMTAAVFPLRARLDSLQRFADSYLNIIPPELGRFHAMAPFVYLMMLDYGKLAVQAKNLGWFSQHEVMFCVPLEWYKVIDGEWVFHDWATVAAFIYVDDPLSMTLGRTVLGWPKSLVRLTPQLTGWMQNPGGSSTDATMTAMVFPKAYADAEMEERVVMEVRSPSSSGLQFPMDPGSNIMPWNMFANAMKNIATAASDYVTMLDGMGLLPWHQGTSGQNFARMATKISEMTFPFAPNLTANTINLKQFRRVDEPKDFCFQALTNGPMQLTSFNRGAMLGETAILAGDLSGGYAIDLVNWPSYPIVDTLGLEAEFVGRDGDAEVSRLTPVMPFWYDVDMEYQHGTRIAWRDSDGPWRDGEGTPYRSFGNAEEAPSEQGTEFNTTAGGGTQVLTGPFFFPSATVRVAPLLADREVLQDLLDSALNTPLGTFTGKDGTGASEAGEGSSTGEHFDVWCGEDGAAYVYMIAAEWGPVTSETNDVGDWASMGATFYVPVKRSVNGKAMGVGLYAALGFADGTTQACTMSELYGVDTIEGGFTLPPVPFASEELAYGQQPHALLHVDAEVLPTVGEGEKTQWRRVLELLDGGGRASTENLPLSDRGEAFCRLLRNEVIRHNAIDDHAKQLGRVCALEVLYRERPIEVYTLKQVRDGRTPTNACYQALVRMPYTIHGVDQIEEITNPIRARIYDYPSLPIVRRFGLKSRDVQAGGGATVYTVEALRPFWMRIQLGLGNGERLWHRTDMEWHRGTGDEGRDAHVPGPLELTSDLEKHISLSHPVDIAQAVKGWLDSKHHASPAEEDPKTLDLERVDLQSILETILSREWEDRSTTSRRRIRRDVLTRELENEASAWGSWPTDNLRMLEEANGGPIDDDQRRSAVLLGRLEQTLLALYVVTGAKPSDDEEQLELAWKQWALLVAALPDEVTKIISTVKPSPDGQATHGLHEPEPAQVRRLLKSVETTAKIDETLFKANVERRKQCVDIVRAAIKLLTPIAVWSVEEALDRLVDERRKPDHVVLRSTAGRERDRIFPISDSYPPDRATWYRGPTDDCEQGA